MSLDHTQHSGGHGHASDHAHAGDHAHAAGHDDHDADVEEKLAPDEQPTPLWLPVVGALLFFVAFILIAAF